MWKKFKNNYARGAGQPRSEICVTVMYVTEMIQLSE